LFGTVNIRVQLAGQEVPELCASMAARSYELEDTGCIRWTLP